MQSVCEIQWVISVVIRKLWKNFCANHGIIEFPTLISKFLICIIFVTYLFFLHKLFNKIICGFTVYMYVYRSDQFSDQVGSDFRSGQVRSGQIRFQIRSGHVRSDQISFQIRSVFRPDQIGFLSNLTWSDLFGALYAVMCHWKIGIGRLEVPMMRGIGRLEVPIRFVQSNFITCDLKNWLFFEMLHYIFNMFILYIE